MIDRDKVISRLQIIRTWAEVGKNYNGIQGEDCLRDVVDWIDDALVLLKEQEPVKPKIEKSVAKTAEETIEISIANCGNCGALIEQPVANESGWSYCPKCGKAVKWDDD